MPRTKLKALLMMPTATLVSVPDATAPGRPGFKILSKPDGWEISATCDTPAKAWSSAFDTLTRQMSLDYRIQAPPRPPRWH